MSNITELLVGKKIIEAQKVIFEALEAKKTERLQEEKKALAARMFSEVKLKNAAIEYEERYGKKPEKTEDLAKLRKDKEADSKKKDLKEGLMGKITKALKNNLTDRRYHVAGKMEKHAEKMNKKYGTKKDRQIDTDELQQKQDTFMKGKKSIQEVSDELKNRYKAKAQARLKELGKTAAKQVDKLATTHDRNEKKSINAGLQKTGNEIEKRETGIARASNKKDLTRKATTFMKGKKTIQEVSAELLSRYKAKAQQSANNLERKGDAQARAARRAADPDIKKKAKAALDNTERKITNRYVGLSRAEKKS